MADIDNSLGNYGSALNLQEVTDNGNTTTNDIVLNSTLGKYGDYVAQNTLEDLGSFVSLTSTTQENYTGYFAGYGFGLSSSLNSLNKGIDAYESSIYLYSSDSSDNNYNGFINIEGTDGSGSSYLKLGNKTNNFGQFKVTDLSNNITLQFPNKTTGTYTIATTDDTSSQTLAQTLVYGNQTDGTNIKVSNADAIELENTSTLKKGTYDFGAQGGISRICGVGYEDMWQSGIRHVFDSNGLIRNSTNCFNIVPDASFDSSLRFKVDSRWTLDDGTTYVCTDTTVGAAVWEIENNNPQTLQDITDNGNTTTNGITVGSLTAGNLFADGYSFGISDNFDGNYNFTYQPYAGLILDDFAGNQSALNAYGLQLNYGTLSYSGGLAVGWSLPGSSGTIALTSEIPSLTGYATESWVSNNYASQSLVSNNYYPLSSNPAGYITSVPSYTLQDVTDNGYITTNNIQLGTGGSGTGTYFLLQNDGFENWFDGGHNWSTVSGFQIERQNTLDPNSKTSLNIQYSNISFTALNFDYVSQLSIGADIISLSSQTSSLSNYSELKVSPSGFELIKNGSFGYKKINLLLDDTSHNNSYYFPVNGGTFALISDIPSPGISDAPSNSKYYSRYNNSWAVPGLSNLDNATGGNSLNNILAINNTSLFKYTALSGDTITLASNATSFNPRLIIKQDGFYLRNGVSSVAEQKLQSNASQTVANTIFQLPVKSTANTYTLATIDDIPTGGGLPAGGTAGQILTKVDATDYNATWQENYADWTSIIKHTVKNNGVGLITKGTPVYVTSSNGTNMLVGKASNTSEATSSKTIGLMQSDITTTGGTQTGFVVTEGLLGGLNTAGTTAGDPVWLGPTGTLIYGLINKPYAPAHLVFIGIVTKVSAGSGEIFVKVQNGFELREIHDVDLITTTPSNNDVLSYDFSTSLWKNKSIIEDNITNGVIDKAPSQNSVFDALALKQDALLSSYTVIANNTSSSSNGTSQTFKSIANQTYTGTPVWTGTTAPSGATTNSYSWNQIGNLVTLRINLVYTTAGSALTAATIPLPTDCPSPYVASGGTPSTNRVIAVGSGVMQTNFAVSTVTTYVILKTNSTNTGFDIIAQRASANYQMVTVLVTYLTT